MKTLTYRGFEIEYSPKPIPDPSWDWDWWHRDCEDACGCAANVEACQLEIDEWLEEEGEEYGFDAVVLR